MEKEIIRNYHPIKDKIFKDNSRILFTGASLSYNRYDFDCEARTNAYECYPGMQSWSFLLRDRIIHNSKGFIHGDVIAAKHANTDGLGEISCGYARAYRFPQYGRVLVYTSKSNTDALKVKYINTIKSKICLYMISNPNETGCEFDIYVNEKYQKTICNSNENNLYQGFEPKIIEVEGEKGKENIIEFKNIKNVKDNEESQIYLLGISQDTINIEFSGQGSTTSKWLYDNIKERILDMNPDVIFVSIVGNDRGKSNPDEFYNSLREVIRKTKAQNKDCEIILMLVPPSTTDDMLTDYNGWIYKESELTLSFFEKANSIADEFNCMTINNFKTFSGIPVNKWRFDNIHMTQYGNIVKADYIWDNIIQGCK